jgi:hypothetical protein
VRLAFRPRWRSPSHPHVAPRIPGDATSGAA